MSLGDSVAQLPAASGTDALVFVRALGEILSGQRRTLNFMNGADTSDSWQIWIMLVDAKNGDVLYLADPEGRSNLAKDATKSRSAIEKSFKNFLKANKPSAGDK